MGRKYIGKHLCIMTGNKNAKKHNNGVIIISHGEQTASGREFDLLGGTVYFYCPDGASLLTNDYDFLKQWAGNNSYSHVASTGKTSCKDYWLSKSIGYHASDAAAKLGKKGIEKLIKTNPTEAENENRTNYKVVEGLVTSGRCPYDVVSIRNRKFHRNDVLLSEVINTLKQAGYGYGEYHCMFCRADDVGRSWDVEHEDWDDEE